MKIFINSEIEAKKLGSNIQVARKRRKMSLMDLASKASISKTALSRIEAGDTTVGFGKILNVLDALGLLTGLVDIVNPDLDREQTINEIKFLREGGNKALSPKAKKSNLVRFID